MLADVTRRALKRWLTHKPDALLNAEQLFNEQERQDLADAIAAVNATAHLLGRAKMQLRLQRYQQHADTFAEVEKFCKTGQNAGKPGPCPEGGDEPAKDKPARAVDTPETSWDAAQRVATGHYSRQAKMLTDMAKGDYDPQDVIADTRINTDRAAKRLAVGYQRHYDALTKQVEGNFPAGAVQSPEWQHVGAEFRQASLGSQKVLGDIAEHTESLAGYWQAAKERGEAPKLRNRDVERIQDLTNHLQDTVHQAFAGPLGDAIQAFKAKWQPKQHSELFAEQTVFTFGDPTPFDTLGQLQPFPPEKALAYFKSKVPLPGVKAADLTADMNKQAFTLAVDADKTVLGRIQDAIARIMETGRGVSAAPRTIQKLLEDAGIQQTVGGRKVNGAYSDNVWRTNAMDAFREGAQDELTALKKDFPVWRWAGIRDGRQRPSHERFFDLYFPSTVKFTDVRDADGYDGYQDRCDQIPIYRTEWQRLKAAGARLAPGYDEPKTFAELDEFCQTGVNAGKPGPCPKGSPEQTQTAKDHVAAALKGDRSPERATVLAGHLSGLTVAQLHAFKKEHGLKASGKTKAALVAQIAARLDSGRREEKPTPEAPNKPAAKQPEPKAPEKPAPISSMPKPKKPRVNVSGNMPTAKRKEYLRGMFGKDVDEGTLGAMANAVDGGNVSVVRQGANRFSVSSEGKGIRATRTISKDKDGSLTIHNDIFEIEDNSPHKGKGVEFFTGQVQSLQEAGVKRIETHAAGKKGDEFNGYYSWPRMGYDGTMSDAAISKLPADLKTKLGGKKNVQALFALPGGKEAWKEHGDDIFDAHFDTTPGSHSMNVLGAYLQERKERGK